MEIKSQDELTEAGGRQSDVLISALEKCEKLEKQLKIAVDGLKRYSDINSWEHTYTHGGDCAIWDSDEYGFIEAQNTLQQIKELDK